MEIAIFTYEFATIEWLWDLGNIQVNLPGGHEQTYSGSYNEVVSLLSELGRQGWDVAACTSSGNWLFWTLRRQR